MQTYDADLQEHQHKLNRISGVLRLIGWIGVWVELALAIVLGLMLVFVVSGRNFIQNTVGNNPGFGAVNFATSPGLGVSIFFAVCSLVVLLFSTFLALRQTQLARALRHPNPERHPSRSAIMQLVRFGVIVGLIGMGLAILGGGAALGVLLSKSIALPQAVGVYVPTRTIQPMDIFVAMANLIANLAHFAGTFASLCVLSWLARQ